MPASFTEHGDVPLELFRAAFEYSTNAMIAVDEHRTIVAANEAAAALYRLPREQLVGRSASSFTMAVNVDQTERLWQVLLAGGTFSEDVEIMTADGEECEVRVTGLGNVEPGVHLAILGDITRRKAHELSSRRYELLREYAEDVVLFIGRDGRIIEANDAAVRTYGYSRDELLQMRVRDLRHPESAHEFEGQFREAFEHGIRFETLHARKDRTLLPVEVATRVATVAGERVLLSVIRDITERQALHAKMLEVDRLSTFGLMAAGLAHEINNPLAYALANTEVLARELPRLGAIARSTDGCVPVARGLDDCLAMVKVAMEGLDRVRSIVRDLKTFSRTDPDEGVLVDLHQVLDSALNVAQAEVRPRALVEKSYGEISPVRGMPSRLGQVFLNLIVNAAQAIPHERRGLGHVSITTQTTREGWAEVQVRDDGVGMPPEVRRRLFEPFHTTKTGEGTGLGLYISHTIVQALGGNIDVESREGQGTTVSVRLPPWRPVSAANG